MRTEDVAGHQGWNGVDWDLRYDGPTLVALKTTPPENPRIWDEPRFQGADTRRITHWGITPQTGIPMAAPGKYRARFTVDGQTLTQDFEVIKDPGNLGIDGGPRRPPPPPRSGSATTSRRPRGW